MSTLYLPHVYDWPATAGWMSEENTTEIERAIVQRALCDNGIQETPLGSNRGTRIDRYLRRAGVPESLIVSGKGWWCASWVGAVFGDCGCLVPRDYGSCDSWLEHLVSEPRIGSAILYGVRGDAHHIGIVAMISPTFLTIEGNRGYAGTTNNGQAVDLNPLARKDILGYFRPRKG